MKKWNLSQKSYLRFIRFIGFSQRTTRSLFRLFQIAVYCIAVVFFINIISIFLLDFDNKVSTGSFGDLFGGVLNPLLTFLMFMGVLITIVLQQKELKLTRKELKKSSMALAEQAVSQEKFIHNQMLTAKIHALSTIIESINVDIKISFQKFSIFYSSVGTSAGIKIEAQLDQSMDEISKHINERITYRTTIENMMMLLIHQQNTKGN
ncbi:MAG: hypothetical protein Q7T36_01450 [Fluviicoccus sp.]|uniref:hypothetical protein n=1 Tax=Fluviicoccus sp. TaxID=2003552 RepID=UPI0027238B3E|nr:hypothetical protein [Fluviicoccus sp.]MDO8329120.1 hypothetical protein [Fluviicoccus sp.]